MTCDRRTYATCARKTDGRVGMRTDERSKRHVGHGHVSYAPVTLTVAESYPHGEPHRCRATTPTLDLSSMVSRCYLDAISMHQPSIQPSKCVRSFAWRVERCEVTCANECGGGKMHRVRTAPSTRSDHSGAHGVVAASLGGEQRRRAGREEGRARALARELLDLARVQSRLGSFEAALP
jgi:hypothetical protein